ncbi:MAG TPA: Uma2 family endonuclease [Terracidiphilus sp.]|nr:Uma2 family endonuclease [Terracidiphilus sp.]
MAVVPQPTPLDVYLNSSFEPDAEFVDGVIEERPMGEWTHADWQAAILEFFRTRRREWNIRAAAELRVQVSPNNFRVPDVAVLDRNQPVEEIVTAPPIAVFEILSPEDTLSRMMSKLSEYAAMGVKTILVIEPKGKNYRFRNGALEPLTESSFDFPGSACRFDLAEIEKLLD